MADDAFIDEWIRTEWPRAVAYAMTLLRDPAVAEDEVQEAFVALLRHREQYDLARDGRKLLYTAVTNRCRNVIARRRGHESLGDDERGAGLTDRRAESPLDAAAAHELSDRIDAALLALPERQRAIVHLSSLGWGLAEVADVVGVTPNNAGVLLHRARRALAEALGPFLDEVKS
ncbi:MAG: sigma-70 family RNA polymerase sigma factor [Planctomycetes bacterium]|nr:sigma-70 family RNA polymerase sigma factor [Planctomycetota bacterium]